MKESSRTHPEPVQRLENLEGSREMAPPPFQLQTDSPGAAPSLSGENEGEARSTEAKPKGKGKKKSGITVKRKHIHLIGSEDKYGHWWTDLGGGESYGWWPKNPVGLKGTLLGTDGELNGQTSFGGTPTQDPHHSDSGEDEYNVMIDSGKNESDVKSEMRVFAGAYSGEWRWTFGFGQNCHTFQKSMLKNSDVDLEKI